MLMCLLFSFYGKILHGVTSSHSLIIYRLICEGHRDVTALSTIFQGVVGVTGASYLSGRMQGTPWTSRQLITGPLLMAEVATQGANCTSGAILEFSILLEDTSTCSSVPPQREAGFDPASFLLYPLSYSHFCLLF